MKKRKYLVNYGGKRHLRISEEKSTVVSTIYQQSYEQQYFYKIATLP